MVKRYLTEPGSPQFRHFIADAVALGSVAISRTEVVATFGKAVRVGAVSRDIAEAARQILQLDWRDFARIDITEHLLDRASDLAWTYGLRGYDSVQLAAAVRWQEELDLPLTMATFDRSLWKAAARVGLDPYPPDLLEIR
jgi:predicted nucleic acid-binding protein